MCLGCCMLLRCCECDCLQIVVVFTFLLDQKGNQKIKHGMIAPRIRACQRLHIA
jgi:hypothetical protein